MNSTFSIIFYLKRQVVKKDGTAPVMGRITVDGTQAQFSCKTTANPELWDTKGGRMTGKSMQALEVNRKLDKMRVSISKHYQEIMDRDNFVTADKVKNAFLGLEYRCHTLMKVYTQSRDEVEKQYKAGMKSLSSFTKYRIGCAYVGEFLQTHYHVKDIALKELSLPFITDYETFLRTDKHMKIIFAMVFVRNLRAMIFRAIDNEWLVKDPFRRYEYKEEETTREFLTKEEIRLLMEVQITRKKMSMVRDLFLFCCFTGLAFIDLYNLKEENIKTFFDYGEWIVIHRQKTGTEANIKLLDYPKQIMEKYRGLCEDGRVFFCQSSYLFVLLCNLFLAFCNQIVLLRDNALLLHQFCVSILNCREDLILHVHFLSHLGSDRSGSQATDDTHHLFITLISRLVQVDELRVLLASMTLVEHAQYLFQMISDLTMQQRKLHDDAIVDKTSDERILHVVGHFLTIIVARVVTHIHHRRV